MNNYRRKLLAFASAGLFAPRVFSAQQSAKVYRVGYLSIRPGALWTEQFFETFKKRLNELGYVEGQNVIINPRSAENNFGSLPALAAELVALKPDVIVAATASCANAVKQATATIPIVMVAVADPVGSKLVSSLAKPGGNITGGSIMALDTVGKTIELLHTVAPKARRIAVLMTDSPTHPRWLEAFQAVAKNLGLTLVPTMAKSPGEIEKAFASMVRENAKAVIVLGDPLFTFQRENVAAFAAKARLPTIYGIKEFVEVGGLMSYGQSVTGMFRLAADYVDKILKGAKPADLPVQQPTEFELAINLKVAKALGITIPQEILLRADKVIE